LQFVLFSFVGRGSVCPGTVLDYVPGVWVEESHILQIHTSSFGAIQLEEMALLFSVQHGIRRLSMD
jgi:hypothetical protein